jgi:hypothetical protein
MLLDDEVRLRAGICHFVPPSRENIWNQTPGGEFAGIVTAYNFRCSGPGLASVIVRKC